jgi:hypothetical protein
MISTTWSCTTRTTLSLAPVTAMQRLKTATDLGALKQAAGAAILTASEDNRRSNHTPSATTRIQYLGQQQHRPILAVVRRATEPASLARTARAPVMGPSGAHRPSAMRRTAANLRICR